MYSQTRLPAARKRGRWVLAVPFWSVQAKGLAIDKRGGATTIIEVVRLSAAGAHDKSGHSSVWLERTVRDREVGGSNPLAPTCRNSFAGRYLRVTLWVGQCGLKASI